jgi:NitT/TauT family transport system substrate-binding protein
MVRAQAPRKLLVGSVTPTALDWPLYVGLDNGFFAEQKLTLDVAFIGNSFAVNQQLIGGSIEIGISSTESAIRAIDAGGPLAIICSETLRYLFGILAPASIKSAADMKGKQIILPHQKSAATILWNRWLKSQGVEPSQVDQVYDGSSINRFAALESGSVRAASLTQPVDFIAMDKGYHRLLDLAQYAGNFAFSPVVARRDWLSKNGDVARSFITAFVRGIRYLYDPKNRDAAIASLIKYSKVDPKYAVRTYDYYVKELRPYDPNGDVPLDSVRAVLIMLADTGDLKGDINKPERYLDLTYLRSRSG